jgi:hypothetical protein
MVHKCVAVQGTIIGYGKIWNVVKIVIMLAMSIELSIVQQFNARV